MLPLQVKMRRGREDGRKEGEAGREGKEEKEEEHEKHLRNM